MTNWQPIETAPKDGRVVMGAMGSFVFPMAWFIDLSRIDETSVGFFFKRKVRKQVAEEPCWRVLLQTRELRYAIHGQIAPVQPSHWQPLLQPPEQS